MKILYNIYHLIGIKAMLSVFEDVNELYNFKSENLNDNKIK